MLFQTEKTLVLPKKPELESERKVLNECLRNSMNFRKQNVNLAKIEPNSLTKKDGLIYSYQWMTDVKMQLLVNRFIEFSSLLCLASSSTPSKTNESTDKEIQEKQQQPQLIIDVFGQETEPICTYYRCRHKFSLHGLNTHGCRCKHPMNKTLGVFMRYDEEK
jgi:hypothetical protein